MTYKIHGIHACTDYNLLTIKLLKKLEIKFAITWFDITGITLVINLSTSNTSNRSPSCQLNDL